MTTVTMIDQLDGSIKKFNLLEKIEAIKGFLEKQGIEYSKSGDCFYKDDLAIILEEKEVQE